MGVSGGSHNGMSPRIESRGDSHGKGMAHADRLDLGEAAMMRNVLSPDK